MKKKIIGTLILCCGLLTACASPSGTDSKLQENAIAAHNSLIEEFGFDEDGNPLYPDEYAGMWVDEQMLVVALTDTSDEVITEYKTAAGEYADYLQFEKAEYSYNDLKAQADDIVTDLRENKDIAVISYSVSETENKIVIGVPFSQYLKTWFVSYDVPVTFEISSEIEN